VRVELRKQELRAQAASTDYSKSKCSTWLRFIRYLKTLPGCPSPDYCTPDDVENFLIASDVDGRTVVHARTCFRHASCTCPTRLAAGTVDSMIGRLRSAFLDIHRVGPDNPAGSRQVKQYLGRIRKEQLAGGIAPRQARPLFSFKLRKVLLRLSRHLRRTNLQPEWRFRMLRQRAMFTLGAKSLKRGRELGETRTSLILRLPDNSGLLFEYVWGKTLRDGSKHVFGVVRDEDPVLCPVAAVDSYILGARDMGIDLCRDGAYLFPPWKGLGVSSLDPLHPKQLQADLTYWLQRCEIYGGETWHGLRAGGSIELAIKGESLSTVMKQAFWKSPAIAQRYVQAWKVACVSVAGGPPTTLTPQAYDSMNRMCDFYKAYDFSGPRACGE
jgi:hypothetical protein